MGRLVSLPLLWLACALGFAGQDAPPSPAPNSRPNLVLIIADDMAWDDSGAYGHPGIRTPHLDRMAQQGMRFDLAFLTISSCSPSRASLITGRYPHNTGAERLHLPLPADQVTFVELLKQAGYWTAAAGKWHLGPHVKDRFDLVREPEDPSGAAGWVPTLQQRPPHRPFFLWLAALDPHRPYTTNTLAHPHLPDAVRVPPYLPDQKDVRADLARYYDEVSRLDQHVGEVLQELDQQGLTPNTLVLFLSDNGRPFPRDKTTLYDSGIHTPWIVRWPGRVMPGTVCPSLVSSVDIAPTFLELAGLTPPPSCDGISFVPLLSDPTRARRHYIHAERHWHDYEAYQRAVRSDRYKYIRNYYPDLPNTPPADAVRSVTYRVMKSLHKVGQLSPAQMNCFVTPRPPEEFYDLQADPYELTNRVENPEVQRELQQLRDELTRWQLLTGDRPPRQRHPDTFDRETGQPLPTVERGPADSP